MLSSAKYPLAIVDKVLENLGSNVFIAYDIGCTFQSTVLNSSLGDRAREQRLHFGVPLWHGWAHNRLCQLQFHPLYQEGLGLKDAEGCERVFSRTNGCARAIRYSTKFHRKQVIDMTVKQWNAEKVQNIGEFVLWHFLPILNRSIALFLYNNYKQAISILKSNEFAVMQLENLGIAKRDDFEGYIQAEQDYLRSLKREPPMESIHLNYLELLVKVQRASWVVIYRACHPCWPIPSAMVQEIKATLDKTKKAADRLELTKKWKRAVDMQMKWEDHTHQYEIARDIGTRWIPTDAAYISHLQMLHDRQYWRALDNLSALLIRRLLELEKMGISGTGTSHFVLPFHYTYSCAAYNLRKSLAQALKKRAAALQRALVEFNKEAKKLKRPQLTMNDLLGYSFIADVEILRESRDDIRKQKWTIPAVRQGIMMWLKMERAKEEMVRVEVEAHRMESWIRDLAAKRRQVIADLAPQDASLSSELRAVHDVQSEHDDNTMVILTRLRGKILDWKRSRNWSTDITIGLENGGGEEVGMIEDADAVDTDDEDDGGIGLNENDENAEQLELVTTFVIDEPYLQ
jgi:Kyakuja-Dileera-Zisupton transposase